jgi:hypothetical protein
MSARPIASRRPVTTYGSAEGRMRSNHIRRSPEQNERATSTSSRSTSCTPRMVLISTGNSTKRITTTVFAVGPNPNHTTMTGISATLGVA